MDDKETSMDNIFDSLQSLIEDCDELQKEFENYRKLRYSIDSLNYTIKKGFMNDGQTRNNSFSK